MGQFDPKINSIRYCEPTHDSNRARWPLHSLWRLFEAVVTNDLMVNCCGVQPSDVISANKSAKMRELDSQLCGLFVTRAAISDVQADDFEEFMDAHVAALMRLSDEHATKLEEKIAKAKARYRLDG
ncbi:MAG: hypothetical protein V7695_20340 [Sulfitobacter sp.]